MKTAGRRNGSTRKFDPVGLVEASYDLRSNESRWLTNLAELGRPALDDGLGVAAIAYDTADEIRVRSAVTAGAPDAFFRWLAEGMKVSPDDGMDFFRNLKTDIGSFSQLTRSIGLDRYVEERSTSDFPVRDVIIAFAREPGQHVWFLGLSRAPRALSKGEARPWKRVLAHVSTGLRLRSAEVPLLMAVLSPNGRLIHAEQETQSKSVSEQLVDAVKDQERARGPLRRRAPEEALRLWRPLVDGRWSLVDRLDSDGKRYLVAYRNAPQHPDPRALTARERSVLFLMARGQSYSEAGYQLGISTGSVANTASNILRKLRLRNRWELDSLLEARVIADLDGIIVGEVPDIELGKWVCMSSAERHVVTLAVQGYSDREIAVRRKTSPRTVANQMRKIFRKLGIVARSELPKALRATTE